MEIAIKTTMYLSILTTLYLMGFVFPLSLGNYTIFMIGCAFFMEYFGYKILLLYHAVCLPDFILAYPAVAQFTQTMWKTAEQIPRPENSTGFPAFFSQNSDTIVFCLMLGAIAMQSITLVFCHKALREIGAYKRFPL